MLNEKYGLESATLNGSKTLTRRNGPRGLEDAVSCGYTQFRIVYNELRCFKPNTDTFISYPLPYTVGEVVAIAQSYRNILESISKTESIERAQYYNRILNGIGWNRDFPPLEDGGICDDIAGWNNKMYVKASLMPHQIRITDIKIERLQDISDEDCLKEGVQYGDFLNTWNNYYFDGCNKVFKRPREAFASLIDKVGKKGTWESNPYVWRIEFELLTKQ